MGRPVQDRKFGNPATKDGPQFYVQADIGAGLEQCFIVRQKANLKFLVESTISGDQALIYLVNGPSEATSPGYGYMEAGALGSNSEAESVSIITVGDGYSVSDTLTVTGGTGTGATIAVDTVAPIDGDEAVHATFTGGDGYSVSDVITMSDGSTVTVDAVNAGAITAFTLDSSTVHTGQAADTATLTQVSVAPEGGTGFDIDLAVPDQAIFTASLATGGSYTVVPTNPVAHSGGTGTGATFTLVFGSTADEYVSKLSNKNLRVYGGLKRDSYTINNTENKEFVDPTKNVSGA